jgi:hypothetical protein
VSKTLGYIAGLEKMKGLAEVDKAKVLQENLERIKAMLQEES